MARRLIILLTLITAFITPSAFAVNGVLSLDGDGDYVEIADSESLNAINSQVTMEAWIKATAFPNTWMPIIYKGDKKYTYPNFENRSYTLWLNNLGRLHLASAPNNQNQITLYSSSGLIALDTWYHVAGVINGKNGVMKMFINGSEVANESFGKDIRVGSFPLRIGWTHEEDRPEYSPFGGQIDGVRIWNIARTQEEIQATIHTTLSGKEPGLVGYWRFGFPLHDGESQVLNLTLKEVISISGKILMLDDTTPHAAVSVQAVSNGKVIDGVLNDENGKYKFVNLKPGPYQVRCYIPEEYVYYGQKGKGESQKAGEILQVERGKTVKNIDFRFAPFKKGTWRHYDTSDGLANMGVHTIYQDSDSILWFGTGSFNTTGSGVSHYDGKTFVTLTTKEGLADNTVFAIYRDPDDIIWFGTGRGGEHGGVSRYDGKEFANFTTEDGLANNRIMDIHQTPDGVLWFGTRGGVSRYDGKEFANFTTKDGLASNFVYAIHHAPDGVLWFGTEGGVSRYDGKEFVNFTTKDGLAHNRVYAIHRAPDGVLWFGTRDGVSRYDGKEFANFTTKDGLASNIVSVIHRDSDGTLWFGTGGFYVSGGGVSRYDGKEFVNFTVKDGLANNRIMDIHQTPDGVMWFATQGGVSRYDGEEFKNFTTNNDGLAYNWVHSIHSAPDGIMWFATGWGERGGISRYDGKEFVNLTTEDGLAHNSVWGGIYYDSDDVMWFGTKGGVSQYDGKEFVNFTQKDGLAGDTVYAIHQDQDGILWFGTYGGGVSGYDGVAWTSLDRRYGLADNRVFSIDEKLDGTLRFGTSEGLAFYRRSKNPPGVQIVSVKMLDKEYTEFQSIPPITTGTRVTIEYNAIDFKTLPERRQYRCRIKELDDNFRKTTKSVIFDHTFKTPGDYTFEVQAIDRDLNYSEPASLTLEVVPPWYLNGWIAIPSVSGIFALLVGFIVLGYRYYAKRREAQQLRYQMLEQEKNARENLQAQNIQLEEAKTDAEAAKDEAIAANRAKSVFLANMSHEIRTPMNAVLGYAQILQRDQELLPRQRDAVDTIENSGNHLLALINDVLDISKIEAGRLELQETDFDLNALIDGISAMFQLRCEREGLRWQVEGLDEDTVLVHGDEGKLRQVLINLLGNAVKFTESGEVILSVAPEAGDVYRFEVRDTGIGIPMEAQAKIFEPFQQSEEGAKEGGTGLGLAISKRQIELMGGELSLESEVGVGSRFFFTLPLPPAESDVIDQASRYSGVTHLAEGYNIKALIADDTKVNRDVLSKMLTDIGVEVMEAENGQQALEMVRASRPKIVFMDIRMPVMDGIEATRRLFDEFGNDRLKIVAISASALRHEEEEYFQAGFDDFIGKPFRFERLCECLANVLSVEYEYAETASDKSEETPKIDFMKVSLPKELLSRLKDAAELYNVTRLERHLGEVELLGDEAILLAEHLRALSQNNEIDRIIEILGEINHESS